MAENTKQYKCIKCGAPLAYDSKIGRLSCCSCGSTFHVEEFSTILHGKQVEENGFDWTACADKFRKDAEVYGAVYSCTSCGAELATDANTVAMTCPYCGNNVILNDRVKEGLRPNGVIPFRIRKEEVPACVRKFYKGKALLPFGFFSDNKIGKVDSIYVPFWLFDCDTDGQLELHAEKTRYYVSGDYDVKETEHYRLYREGAMSFEKITVDASVRMDNDLMDSLEPFDYSELRPYDSGYLAGYLADRYDEDVDQCMDRATERAVTTIEEQMKSDAGAYLNIKVVRNGMQITDADVHYALLPVHVFHCFYKGKKYRYAVNGQTGKVVGDLPTSHLKGLLYFIAGFVPAAAAVCALLW